MKRKTGKEYDTAQAKGEERWKFIDKDEDHVLTTKFVPKNIAASTKWALTNFLEWKKSRNDAFITDVDKQVPDDLLQSIDPDELRKWFKLYVAETRKKMVIHIHQSI